MSTLTAPLTGAEVRALVTQLAASEDRLRGLAGDPRGRRQVLREQERLVTRLRTYRPA